MVVVVVYHVVLSRCVVVVVFVFPSVVVVVVVVVALLTSNTKLSTNKPWSQSKTNSENLKQTMQDQICQWFIECR